MRRFLALLTVLALVAASCGGGEADPVSTTAGDATTTTAAVAETTTTVAPPGEVMTLDSFLSEAKAGIEESYRFSATISSDGPALQAEGLTEGMNMTVTAAIDPANNASSISMDMGDLFSSTSDFDTSELTPDEIAALSEPIEIITIGTQSWTRMGFFAAMFGIDPSFYVEGRGDMVGVEDMAADFAAPEDFTQLFEDADADVEDLGIEVIRGVETRHIRAIVDGEKMAATVDPAERDEFETNFPSDVEFPIDVWVGEDDGRLYRYVFEMTELALAQTDDPDMEGIDFLRVEVEAWDYGVDPGITAPPADMVVSEEELTAGLFGG